MDRSHTDRTNELQARELTEAELDRVSGGTTCTAANYASVTLACRKSAGNESTGAF